MRADLSSPSWQLPLPNSSGQQGHTEGKEPGSLQQIPLQPLSPAADPSPGIYLHGTHLIFLSWCLSGQNPQPLLLRLQQLHPLTQHPPKALPPLQSQPRAGRTRAWSTQRFGKHRLGCAKSIYHWLLTHIPRSWRPSTTHTASHPKPNLQLLPLHQQGFLSFPLAAHTEP